MPRLTDSMHDARAVFRGEIGWQSVGIAAVLATLIATSLGSIFELPFRFLLARTLLLAGVLLLTNAIVVAWGPRGIASWIAPVAATMLVAPLATVAYYVFALCKGSFLLFILNEGKVQGCFLISVAGAALAPLTILGARLRDSLAAANRLALHFEAERVRLNRRALDAQLLSGASADPLATAPRARTDKRRPKTSRERSVLTMTDLPALSTLLDDALELDAPQRLAWLEALPAEHARLGPLLRQMLVENDSIEYGEFLKSLPPLRETVLDRSAPRVGGRVGPWRLMREIGLGGMGRVWLAERADGQFRRQVALKLPLLAWDDGLMERMARERQISALMEHPGIARLYDAGLDDLGRPYLALEYIDGTPIDAWCDARDMAIPDRLRLVAQVAEALAYAHEHRVIHRDLKPSNVLVSSDGRAHLLDFGIARLLLDETPGGAEPTRGGRMMTPRYAAPEQILGEPGNCLSDVYSLGVLAFELLSGQMPYAPRRETFACWEEAVLRDGRTCASSMARNRADARALRGDIDAIIGKAICRLPGDRYSTVAAFAGDIANHLAGRRVLARRSVGARRLADVAATTRGALRGLAGMRAH